jgi:lipid-A-disaccharide synthase
VVSTGELSGEIHALHLLEALRTHLAFGVSGLGGSRLAGAGVDIVHNYKDISLMGVSELFSKAGHILRAFHAMERHLRDTAPSLLILVDFPGFNLRLAKIARRLGIPTVYFIPPQLWAWRKGRIKTIRNCVDLVLCILPFEEEMYRENGVEAVYVGHPFVQTVKASRTRDEFLAYAGVTSKGPLLTVMPGSRESEILRLLPVMVDVVKQVKNRVGDIAVVLPVAETVSVERIQERVGGTGITLLPGLSHDALAYCDAAVIASGSATLEAAILGAPSVVVYRLAPLSYWLARLLVHVPHISLPNLIAGHEIYPEFIQRLEPEIIADRVVYMLNNGTTTIRRDLDEVRSRLGAFDSYRAAAESIVRFVERVYGPVPQTP